MDRFLIWQSLKPSVWGKGAAENLNKDAAEMSSRWSEKIDFLCLICSQTSQKGTVTLAFTSLGEANTHHGVQLWWTDWWRFRISSIAKTCDLDPSDYKPAHRLLIGVLHCSHSAAGCDGRPQASKPLNLMVKVALLRVLKTHADHFS